MHKNSWWYRDSFIYLGDSRAVYRHVDRWVKGRHWVLFWQQCWVWFQWSSHNPYSVNFGILLLIFVLPVFMIYVLFFLQLRNCKWLSASSNHSPNIICLRYLEKSGTGERPRKIRGHQDLGPRVRNQGLSSYSWAGKKSIQMDQLHGSKKWTWSLKHF